MADKCNYVLKALYNGVYGYTNDELTDKKAEKLAKEHGRGYELFAVLPVDIQKKVDERKAAYLKAKEEADEKATILADKIIQEAKANADAAIRETAIADVKEIMKAKKKARKDKLALRTKTKK